jgi:hypothetical protein
VADIPAISGISLGGSSLMYPPINSKKTEEKPQYEVPKVNTRIQRN